jgi:hypothetical protein
VVVLRASVRVRVCRRWAWRRRRAKPLNNGPTSSSASGAGEVGRRRGRTAPCVDDARRPREAVRRRPPRLRRR